jgi:hypothetical protein
MKEGYILTHLRIYSAAILSHTLIVWLIVETTVVQLGTVKAERFAAFQRICNMLSHLSNIQGDMLFCKPLRGKRQDTDY